VPHPVADGQIMACIVLRISRPPLASGSVLKYFGPPIDKI
jgi:hypothetical protein